MKNKKLTYGLLLGGIVYLIFRLKSSKNKKTLNTDKKQSVSKNLDKIANEVKDAVNSNKDNIKQDQVRLIGCDWLRSKYGEDAVVTRFGVIKSSKNTANGTKTSIGWRKGEKYTEYKDGGCFEDIPYSFPY